MIKIDQEVLCDFCEDNCDSKRDRCEGNMCEEAKKMYLEDHGIVEKGNSQKTFANLSVDDVIYELAVDKPVPVINKRIVNSLGKHANGLRIFYHSTEGSKSVIIIPINDFESARWSGFFIYKSDCDKALEELCLDRIRLLAKAMGSA